MHCPFSLYSLSLFSFIYIKKSKVHKKDGKQEKKGGWVFCVVWRAGRPSPDFCFKSHTLPRVCKFRLHNLFYLISGQCIFSQEAQPPLFRGGWGAKGKMVKKASSRMMRCALRARFNFFAAAPPITTRGHRRGPDRHTTLPAGRIVPYAAPGGVAGWAVRCVDRACTVWAIVAGMKKARRDGAGLCRGNG